MLGDTKQQAVTRYGDPYYSWGHILYYKTKGYIISQWYNESGICEIVGYSRLQGSIEKIDLDKILNANLGQFNIQPTDWVERQCANPDTRVWLTVDGHWYFESGVAPIADSKYKYAYVGVGTAAGVAKMAAEGKAGNPQQPPIDDNAHKVDL
jgi:hypothetical protein